MINDAKPNVLYRDRCATVYQAIEDLCNKLHAIKHPNAGFEYLILKEIVSVDH